MDKNAVDGRERDRPVNSWSVIPSARSSATVRRQVNEWDIEELGGLLPLKTRTNQEFEETLRNGHYLPVGVSSKVVARRSTASPDNQEGNKEPKSFHSLESLPHPSKLKKKKQKRSKRKPSQGNNYGFDVTAHVAQLKRKHAEFKWLPIYQREDLPLACAVDEEPFPQSNTGPQCVPSSPVFTNASFELQSEFQSKEMDWHLPPFKTKDIGLSDIFSTIHKSKLSGLCSVPSYASATRGRSQEDIQDDVFNFAARNSPLLTMEQDMMPRVTSHCSQFGPDGLFFSTVEIQKEE